MAEVVQWEYRVQTFGSVWRGVKAEELEQVLNVWGEDGWEVVSSHAVENSNKINIIAKRPLTDSVRRQRSMPRGW
jgi:hypothetical protein